MSQPTQKTTLASLRHRRTMPLIKPLAFVVGLLSGTVQWSHASSAQPAPVDVVNMRLGHLPGKTRVVFDLSAAPASHHLLPYTQGEKQLFLELAGAHINEAHGSVAPSAALQGTPIESIDATTLEDSDGLRYHFALNTAVEPKVFLLEPYLSRGHRLVVDLYYANTEALDPADSARNIAAIPVDPSTAHHNQSSSASIEQPEATGQTLTSSSQPLTTTRSASPYRRKSLQVASTDTPSEGADTTQSRRRYQRKSTDEAPLTSKGEWSGYGSIEARLFPRSPRYAKQDSQNVSLALEPQYFREWDRGDQQLSFRPFFRLDANDDERSHADIRELYWRMQHDNLVFKAGVDVVFWGVTESQHLVDIINQTDLVENLDGEDKLGQPMLNVDYMSGSWGTLQAYLLPYFRERSFPSEKGRLRINPYIDADAAQYDSSDKRKHLDYAIRWSHYIGDWDIGLAHFSGTSREPVFTANPNGSASLAPLYLQVDQTSLDVQATMGAWLWKLEAIYNDNPLEDYVATVAGFEYTLYGIRGSAADLGLLMEYHYDERGRRALSPYQDDLFLGIRYSGNDIASTQLLAGILFDTDNDSSFFNFEAERRLGEHWTLALDARVFANIDDRDRLLFFARDDYLEVQLARHF